MLLAYLPLCPLKDPQDTSFTTVLSDTWVRECLHGGYCWCQIPFMRLEHLSSAALSPGYCLLHRIPFHQTEAIRLRAYPTPIALLSRQRPKTDGHKESKAGPLAPGCYQLCGAIHTSALGTRLKLVSSQDLLA